MVVSDICRTSLQIPASSFRSSEKRDRLLSGVLSWLVQNINFFDPPQEDDVFDVSPDHLLPGRRRKAFGELGLALLLAHRVPELKARPEIGLLTDAWLTMSEQRNVFFDVRRRIHLVPLMAVALTVLSALKAPSDSTRRALQNVLDRKFLDRTERSAAAQVDLKYYLDLLGLRHALPDAATLFERSTLVEPPSLVHAQRIDLYATTHLIFHLSGFGADGIRGATNAQLSSIREYVALALAMCLAEEDFDLAAEFLICRICLRTSPDELSRYASDALLQAQQPAGFIPDLAWLKGLKKAATAEEYAREEFFAVYHPTIVALILLSCDMADLPVRHLDPV